MKEEEKETEEKKKKKVTEIIKKTIGAKLITYTKKLKLKIQSRVWNFKNTMLKKRKKKKKTRSKNYKICIFQFAEEDKNRVFFFFAK